jgi:membrane peptidoglycan carboxypeptidase
MVLAKRLDNVIEDEIKDSIWKLSNAEMTHAKKERVLELYLNYIFLWNNAYWVEAAAQTYFWWSASGLNVLQSSILASIPKWPSLYNPYKNRSQVVWEIKIKDGNKNEYPFSSGWLQDEIISKITSILYKADFSNKTDYNSFSKYIKWLLEFTVYYEWSKYDVEYSLWRKDFVLSRMFEDEYITQEELVDAFIEWLNLEFQSSGFPIRAPHFVMRVTELLEQQYDKETLMNGWLVVKTTLDLDIQDIAEKSLLDNVDALAVYWATNESMVYLDTENGDILAYIGSIDYFNDDIGWQNDMIRSSRQVWSAMKPLIYSLWFSLLPLTLDTPIYDIPFQIWPDRPNNADWKFLGILPLKKALAYSRNVPAAKVITALWWQDVALPFLRKLWLSWLDQNWDYGYPLAFGAWEVPLIELANAYSHLSNSTPWEINPILEIRTNDDSLLYQKEVRKQEEVIVPGISYLLRSILSDPANMPPERASKYAVRGLKFWLKSGTSNMKTPKWDRARDWLLVTYTPSRVALFWGW